MATWAPLGLRLQNWSLSESFNHGHFLSCRWFGKLEAFWDRLLGEPWFILTNVSLACSAKVPFSGGIPFVSLALLLEYSS